MILTHAAQYTNLAMFLIYFVRMHTKPRNNIYKRPTHNDTLKTDVINISYHGYQSKIDTQQTAWMRSKKLTLTQNSVKQLTGCGFHNSVIPEDLSYTVI